MSTSVSAPDPSVPPSEAPSRATAALRWFGGRGWWVVLLGTLAANWVVLRACAPTDPTVAMPYSVFKENVAGDNVRAVTSVGDRLVGSLAVAWAPPPGKGRPVPASTAFETQRPAFDDPALPALLDAHGVILDAADDDRWSLVPWLFQFGPTLVLVAAFVYISRRAAASGAGGLFGLGTSKARRYTDTDARVTFADVAGIDEAEAELVEIVDFLKNPGKYQRLGGTMPKGVLLVGAPGTGKTLLARAIAGEAGVPFFSLSASEFIEMIVGVGAARVRDLFRQAREAAPAILFVDELDAIGRSRSAGAGMGGHDEREQTLNQLLTEMDGFDPREGIVVLAATNRPDVLDAALLRPGRFDRRILVQQPDRAGRAAILAVHTRKVPLAPDVSLDALAAQTPGLVGADLKNLVNEAALLAARQGAAAVGTLHLNEAIQKILLGPVRHVLLTPKDRERTAYHEAGHALLAMVVPGSDPLHRVSIVPRGLSLGATWQLPIDDRVSYAEDYLRTRITCALGGRAAEQLVYGVVTTGAENDLQQVTELARRMVLRWGMSEALGPISFVAARDEGLPPAFQQPYSEATAELIDREVRRLVDACHTSADRLLALHRTALEAIARALLERESLVADEVWAASGLPRPATDASTASAAA